MHSCHTVIGEAVAGGPLTRKEMASVLEAAGIRGPGDRVGAMLMHAELTSVVCSGPMRGKQHTYAAFDDQVPPGGAKDEDEALSELAWRYFSTRGPATVRDFAWWAGLNAGDARLGLELVSGGLELFEADGLTYWMAEPPKAKPSAGMDLIQCYDEIVVSYRESRHVMVAETFDYPTISTVDGFRHPLLRNGQLFGHWRTPSGSDQVETRITGELAGPERAALDRETARYLKFIRGAAGDRP